MKIRTGIGFDVHRLESGLPLHLGGITIEHEKGCVAHSDGDVLIHAICDALLGAASLGDIGLHFPDTSDEFKNIDSKILLKRTVEMIRKEGYEIGNIDCTIILQRPKVQALIPEMQRTIAEVCGVDVEDISVKATTTEHLGFEGREEGISALATALILKY